MRNQSRPMPTLYKAAVAPRLASILDLCKDAHMIQEVRLVRPLHVCSYTYVLHKGFEDRYAARRPFGWLDFVNLKRLG